MLPGSSSLPVLQLLFVHYLNERGTNRILKAHPELIEQVLFLLEFQKEKLRVPNSVSVGYKGSYNSTSENASNTTYNDTSNTTHNDTSNTTYKGSYNTTHKNASNPTQTPTQTLNPTQEHIYSIEIERTEWILVEYLNIRLRKLRNTYYSVETNLITEEEREYHRAYLKLHEKSGILLAKEKIPFRFQKKRPEHAGFYVLSRETKLEMENQEIEAEPGDFFIADISTITKLLTDAKVMLV